MTPIKRLSLALAAMAVAGGLSGPANALSSNDVTTIRGFVEAGDDAALRSWLLQNLALFDDSPLSAMLRDYIQSPPTETIFVSLGVQNPMPEDLQLALQQAKSDPSIY